MAKLSTKSKRRAVRWPSTQIVEFQRSVLRDAGQNPAMVPDEPFRMLRIAEVEERLGIGEASIYRAMRAGKFPRPVTLDYLMKPTAAEA